MQLHQLYRPLSANGFRFDESYVELPPSPALAPYIHSFWGTPAACVPAARVGRIIPDTCMDLIFRVFPRQNRAAAQFCALDDAPVLTTTVQTDEPSALLGIRFYFWSAVCFAEDSLKNSMKMVYPAEQLFPSLCRAILPRLFDCPTLAEFQHLAEPILLQALRPDKMRPDVLNAAHAMIAGAARGADAAQAACLSLRQLERSMREMTGASPKLLSQLIRVQQVYREILEGRYHPQDAVMRYGYADQSHLVRHFHRFFGMTPGEILQKDVAFLLS